MLEVMFPKYVFSDFSWSFYFIDFVVFEIMNHGFTKLSTSFSHSRIVKSWNFFWMLKMERIFWKHSEDPIISSPFWKFCISCQNSNKNSGLFYTSLKKQRCWKPFVVKNKTGKQLKYLTWFFSKLPVLNLYILENWIRGVSKNFS